MNRNVESHFSQLPEISIGRSIFDRSSTHKTSFNTGDLIPIYVDEILPGDTFKMTTSKVVRLQTMLTPIMDNMYLDTYWFFVPNRLIWSHWKEFMGENNSSAWVQQTQYQIPTISSPAGGFNTGTIADYMGLPVKVGWSNNNTKRPSALPFRAYALVADSFFRDQNLTDPLNIPTGDSNQTGTNGSSYINDVANGGMPFKVAKYHDYFTSALPQAQKAVSPVTFPLLSGKEAPVYARNNLVPRKTSPATGYGGVVMENDVTDVGTSTNFNYMDLNSALYNWEGTQGDVDFESAFDDAVYSPANLWADLTANVGAVTVNQLRLAFQLQKFYEKQALAGTRYIEVLKSHFGVTSPDARLQRPEYLGGNRISLAVHEVTNSAQSTQDFLGDLGAKSATSDVHMDFEHSFTEHGILLGLCCVRYDHSYPQGIEKFWTRSVFTDFYWPVFANLGNMPIYTYEIFANGNTLGIQGAAPSIFGYQEAWAEYRYKPNRVSGEMRPGIANSLASWHLADNYASAPTLSDAWIREDKANVDRVLAVTSANANQVFADFYFDCSASRAMPVYSIPGLIDHH